VSTLVGVEFLKLRTTRAWIGYLAALVALSAIGAAGQIGSAKTEDLGGPHFQRDVLASAQTAGLLALLIGITVVTAEWRYGTITRTFLVTPRRERVLVAKEIAAFVVGALLAVLAVVVVLAIAVPWLSIEGASLHVGSASGLIGRTILAAALWGALGVGFGALVRSQTVGLIVAILWVVLVEPLSVALLRLLDLDHVADALPAGALQALEANGGEHVSAAAGAAIGLAYVLALGALGILRVLRSDVT